MVKVIFTFCMYLGMENLPLMILETGLRRWSNGRLLDVGNSNEEIVKCASCQYLARAEKREIVHNSGL